MKHPENPDFFREPLNTPHKGPIGHDFFHSVDGYHHMIDQIEDYAIIILDPQGSIENWNKGAERIKGYQAEEVIGKNFSIFYTEQDQLAGLPQKMIETAAREGKATMEGWRVRKNGSKFWGNILISAVYNDAHEVIGFTKVTRDLTERKNAEDFSKQYTLDLERKNFELERVNKELQAFAYVSSHDLQEPLRKIQAFSEKILDLESDALSDQGRDYLNRMNNAASRMKTLIEDLLSYAQTSARDGEFEVVNIEVLVREVIDEMREIIDTTGARIVVEELAPLKVIRFQFKQMMQNFLSNAIKFSKTGVTPIVHVSGERVKGNVEGVPGADHYQITIRDNGIGFDMQYKEKIFELFQRLHGRHEFPGTGIGLAICKKIVENHNGTIAVSSTPGEGTEFTISLPVDAS